MVKHIPPSTEVNFFKLKISNEYFLGLKMLRSKKKYISFSSGKKYCHQPLPREDHIFNVKCFKYKFLRINKILFIFGLKLPRGGKFQTPPKKIYQTTKA